MRFFYFIKYLDEPMFVVYLHNTHTNTHTFKMQNPFDELKSELVSLKEAILAKPAPVIAPVPDPYVPVSDIIGTYCGRTMFYDHVKNGTIKIYKLGNKTFVKSDEFFSSSVFVPVAIAG